MNNNQELINELQEVKEQIQSIYNQIGYLRDNFHLQDGFNKIREILPAMEHLIALQQDLIIFSNRNDLESIENTKKKINKIKLQSTL